MKQREGSIAGLDLAHHMAGTPPNWYLNLMAHPQVGVETRDLRGRYDARIVDDAEAAALWPKLDAVYPSYAKYRQRSRRRSTSSSSPRSPRERTRR